MPFPRPWWRLATHPVVWSVATHAALIAALWSGVGRLGPRGPGTSACSDGARDDAAVASWDPADVPPPPEDDEPEFEAAETAATPPPEAVEPTAPVDVAPIDATPAEVESPSTADEPALAEPPARALPLAPGRPIPRTTIARAAPPAPVPPPRVAAVATPLAAPAAPPRPVAAPRAGGGFGVRPPVPDPSNRDPVFPPDAWARGERGRVTLLLRLSADGAVLEATIAQSSGSAALDRAALDAARGWRFRPAMRDDGTAIAASVRRGVNFD